MTTTKPFALGSISTGTLRTEDLLPVLADELLRLAPGKDRDLLREVMAYLNYDKWANDPGEIIQAIMSALNAECPPFVYFGAHPDHGANLGFWPDWDRLREECAGFEEPYQNYDYILPDFDIVDGVSQGHVVVQFHGKDVTVMNLGRQVLWTTT